jgi:hypothetical protein
LYLLMQSRQHINAHRHASDELTLNGVFGFTHGWRLP